MTTVLIADDEPSLRLLVSATIVSDEYDVVEAVDGDEAWELLRKLGAKTNTTPGGEKQNR